MRKLTLALVALATAAAIAPSASATSIAFSLTGSGLSQGASTTFNVSGTLLGNGDVEVTGVSGGSAVIPSIGTVDITGLSSGTLIGGGTLDPPTDTLGAGKIGKPGDYDDLIIPNGLGGYTLDNFGLAFELANGDEIQVYINASYIVGTHSFAPQLNLEEVSGQDATYGNVDTFSGPPSDLTITETPEPSSLFLLGTGLLGMAGVVFFRKAKPAKNLILKP